VQAYLIAGSRLRAFGDWECPVLSPCGWEHTVNSTRRAIFGDTHFEFSTHSVDELEDLIGELEYLLALERRNPSPRRTAVSARQWNDLAGDDGTSVLECVA
jgi:hypothetical protein